MSEEDDLSFGALLRRHREDAALTQEELAERAGLTGQAVGALERGVRQRPYPETVRRLADALALTGAERAVFVASAKRRGSNATAVGGPPDIAAPPAAPSGASAPGPRGLLVGRAREVAAIERQFAGDGPPVLLLAGEPGIGKTRLLQEAARRAAPAWRVLAGGCHRRGGQEPYAPLLGALERYIAGRDPDCLRTDLQGCAWLAQLLPELADGPLAGRPAGTLPPAQERRLMFGAVARFLANVAGPAGTLLVLDDLQWAGADALDLLATLARAQGLPGGVPLRIIAAYRDNEVERSDPLSVLLADLAHAGLVARQTLDPLPPPDARLLLDDLLVGGDAAADAVAERVLARAGGVPFFLVSCAHGLRSRAVESAAAAADAVPWDVAQSVRQRVAALPEAARAVLGAAAVIGRRVPYALVLDVSARPEEEAQRALDSACQARLLVEVDDASAEVEVYQFPHDVLREVIEADLGAARRTALHRRAAEALERHPDLALAETLAYHYARSGAADKAARYLQEAGDHARGQLAFSAAERHYCGAVDRLEGLGRMQAAASVREKLGAVLRLAARYDEALAALEPAAGAYRTAGDREGVARVVAQIGRAHAGRGTPDEGVGRLRPLLASPEAGQPSAGLTDVDLALAWLSQMRGAYEEGMQAAARAAARAGALGDDRALAEAHGARGGALYAQGRVREALAAYERAIPLAEAAGDPDSLRSALSMVGHAYLLRGDVTASRRHLDRALATAEEMGDAAAIAFDTFHRGYLLFHAGDWPGARRDCARALALGRQMGTSWRTPYILLGMGYLRDGEGAWEEAAAYLEECVGLAARMGDVQPRWPAETRLAQGEIREGQPAAARARLAALLDEGRLPPLGLADVAVPLAEALLALGLVDEAQARLKPAVAHLRAEDLRLTLVDALRVQTLLAAQQGRRAEAARAVEEGLALARQIPYPYAEARLLHTAATLDARQGEVGRARERLDVAHRIFERLGARGEAALVRAEAERLSGLAVRRHGPSGG